MSKILTALGPHGVQISNKEETHSVRGFSSILANADIPDEEVSAESKSNSQVQPNAGSSSKKGKKKKGKK